jgi:hypothetical protein
LTTSPLDRRNRRRYRRTFPSLYKGLECGDRNSGLGVLVPVAGGRCCSLPGRREVSVSGPTRPGDNRGRYRCLPDARKGHRHANPMPRPLCGPNRRDPLGDHPGSLARVSHLCQHSRAAPRSQDAPSRSKNAPRESPTLGGARSRSRSRTAARDGPPAAKDGATRPSAR